jgi:hypothetical protein
MMHTVVHPGPAPDDRLAICHADGRPVTLTLAAGIPLETAMAEALAAIGCDDSAYLELSDAAVTDLVYVMPAESTDDEHVAWYSGMHRFEGPGVINHMGMIVGYREARCFIHGHGTWTPQGGPQAMGHILAPMTVLAEPATATGFVFSGARFEGVADAETNFTLFSPVSHGQGAAPDADFALLRMLPNQDFDTALDAAVARLGWDSARAWGVGSINRPRFADGRVLDSLPTELLILDAVGLGSGAAPHGADIRIVGTGADQIEQGRLMRGSNSILITAELILQRDS